MSRAISSAGCYGAVVRTFAQARLEAFAAAAPRLRVVNALTNEEHPCQALADCLTMIERWGSLRGRTIAYVGDGNNVALSLAQAATMLGRDGAGGVPRGYELKPAASAGDRASRARSAASLRSTDDPVEAVRGADAVYTDVWTSMGQESEADAAARDLRAVSGQRRADGARRRRRAVHALPAGAPRRGSHRRGHRLGGLGGVRPVREPAAHAEGAAGDARRLIAAGRTAHTDRCEVFLSILLAYVSQVAAVGSRLRTFRGSPAR